MTHNHTPGPWSVSAQPNGPQWVISAEYTVGGLKLSSGRQAICSSPAASTRYAGEYAEMFKANAKLIAAAPDLLEALQGLDEAYCRAGSPLTRDERHEDRLRLIAAREAIAKATK